MGKILCCEVRAGSAEGRSEDALFRCFFPFFRLSHNHLAVKGVRTDIKSTLQLGLLMKTLFYGPEKLRPSSLTRDLKTGGLTAAARRLRLPVLRRFLGCAGKRSWESREISPYF